MKIVQFKLRPGTEALRKKRAGKTESIKAVGSIVSSLGALKREKDVCSHLILLHFQPNCVCLEPII